jgi:hypothetical protein
MSVFEQTFSNHTLPGDKYIDIKSLIVTLNAIRVLEYNDIYDISNTTCRDSPLKESVINFYKKEGVCKDAIVVTDDNFCLDGRHRVSYRKQIDEVYCAAYIVPRKYVNKFIKRR